MPIIIGAIGNSKQRNRQMAAGHWNRMPCRTPTGSFSLKDNKDYHEGPMYLSDGGKRLDT